MCRTFEMYFFVVLLTISLIGNSVQDNEKDLFEETLMFNPNEHYISIDDRIKLRSLFLNIQKVVYSDVFNIPDVLETNELRANIQEENANNCKLNWQVYMDGLNRSDILALKMFDASAKFSHGILDGNTKWMGSYDECVGIEVPAVELNINITSPPFKGRYCTANVRIEKILPTNVNVKMGICVPDSCSGKEAKKLLDAEIKKIKDSLPPDTLPFKLNSISCLEEPELDDNAYTAITILSIFGALMTICTLYDIIVIQWPKGQEKKAKEIKDITEVETIMQSGVSEKSYLVSKEIKAPPKQNKESTLQKLALSFSVYSNGKKILNTSQGSGTLTACNGIRFLSISWVVLGHHYSAVRGVSYNYAAVGPSILDRWTFQAVLNALVSVDSFFALSGLLLAYVTLNELEKRKGRLNWAMFYFHRVWRLTPVYMMALMMSATLSRYFGDGPNWPKNGFENDFCKKTWWKNILYINNLFEGSKCIGVSWYLANDMQFFCVSPLLLIPLYFHKVIGLVVCFVFLLGSAITPGLVSAELELPPTTSGGGGTPSGRSRYFNDFYIKPWCRIGPYIVGIIVGYFLYKTKCQFKINKFLNLFLWAIFATMAIVVLYGLHDALNGDPLTQEMSNFYNAMHKIVWGACVCWVIFACATGNGGFVNTILSWAPFTPLARLSYCVYLIHMMVLNTFFKSLRDPLYLGDLNVIYIFLGHLVISNMAAFVASLAFEAPMMGLEKVVFKR